MTVTRRIPLMYQPANQLERLEFASGSTWRLGHVVLALVMAVCAIGPLGWGQVIAADPAPQSPKSPPVVARADLAASYLRLERVFFAAQLPPETIAKVNREFDQATLAFFTGRNAEAIRTIDGLAELIAPSGNIAAAITSLKVVVDPPVWRVGQPAQAQVRVSSLYDWLATAPRPQHLTIRLVSPEGRAIAEREIASSTATANQLDLLAALEVPADGLSAGVYSLELGQSGQGGRALGRVNVVAGEPLDQQRAGNARRLAGVQAKSPALAQALASCVARNQLLTDRPSDTNSAQFLADLNALASEIQSEVRLLEEGRNPYARRPGDYWRVVQLAKGQLPVRVFASDAATQDAPCPLLIVLHGMGGDENMFLEAYGAGMIKQLAARHGLLVASPLTYRFGGSGENLDALVEALGHDYAIDRQRIYVLGHSMGAGATASLARARSDGIAAACCIAGGSFSTEQASAPLLAVVPELDAVVPPKTVQASATKAASAGKPVELRVLTGYGHTLAVGAILPEAIDWLLGHRLTAR